MKTITAIVIADDHYNGLGVIRSLGLAQVKVTLILMTLNTSFIDLSKYVDKCIKVPHSSDEIKKTIIKIVNTSNDCNIALFPLSDFAAQVLDEINEELPDNVLCPNAKGQLFELSNKYYIKGIAEECGLLVPKGTIIELNKLDVFSWTLFPAIIKPLVSVEGAKSDIAIINNLLDLKNAFDRYRDLGYERALIEEYIDGENAHMVEVIGARNLDGSVDYAGIIRKIREFPIKNGSTSYASLVQLHEGIDFSIINRFLSELSFFGIFDIEYKFANGNAYFIECNFRNGAPGFVFTKNGYNIPALWINKNFNLGWELECFKVSDIDFMIEQNDIINMLKGSPDFVTWIKQYKNACKVFSFRGDNKPVCKYYLNFITNMILKLIKRR